MLSFFSLVNLAFFTNIGRNDGEPPTTMSPLSSRFIESEETGPLLQALLQVQGWEIS